MDTSCCHDTLLQVTPWSSIIHYHNHRKSFERWIIGQGDRFQDTNVAIRFLAAVLDKTVEQSESRLEPRLHNLCCAACAGWERFIGSLTEGYLSRVAVLLSGSVPPVHELPALLPWFIP